MNLATLVDLEARLAADADADAAALRLRDGAVFAERAPPADRVAVLRAWIDANPPGVGDRVARAHRLTRLALTTSGLALGWGATTTLLAYDGRHPVNVAHAVVVLVGLQILTLALLAAGALLRPLLRRAPPALLDLREAAAGLVLAVDRALARLGRAPDEARRAAWRAAWHRLRSRRSLYPAVERWLLLGATQAFGVAFNVGALLSLVGTVAFTDVAFAWGTTFDVGGDALATALDALATPWGWLWPAAVPDVALIEATRYTRLDAAYLSAPPGVRVVDAAMVGAWWRFLLAALLTYGLVPRVLLALLARRGLRRALATLKLDTPDVDAVVRRLTAHRVRTQAADPERFTPPAPIGAPGPTPATDAPARYAVVLWRDVPAPDGLVERAVDLYGGALAATLRAPDYAAERAALDALAATDARVLVLAEGWEAPDKAVRRFVGEARAAVGPGRPLVVALIAGLEGDTWRPAAPADVTLWRQQLARAEDPYLRVEALEAAP